MRQSFILDNIALRKSINTGVAVKDILFCTRTPRNTVSRLVTLSGKQTFWRTLNVLQFWWVFPPENPVGKEIFNIGQTFGAIMKSTHNVHLTFPPHICTCFYNSVSSSCWTFFIFPLDYNSLIQPCEFKFIFSNIY